MIMNDSERLAIKQKEIDYYKRYLNETTSSVIGLEYHLAELSREAQQMRNGFELIASLQKIELANGNMDTVFDRFAEDINIHLQMDVTFILLPSRQHYQYFPKFVKAFAHFPISEVCRNSIVFSPEIIESKASCLVNSDTPNTPFIEMMRERLAIKYFVMTPILHNNQTIAFIVVARYTEDLQNAAKLLNYHLYALEAIAGVISTIKGQIDKNILLEEKVRIRTRQLREEKEKSDLLLLNVLPKEIADELKETGTAQAKHFNDITVLFTDFKNFTSVGERLSPQDLVAELHACFKEFDEITGKYNIEKIKTIGDAYLAVCGLPIANEKHAENVVNAALEIREFMVNRRRILGEKTFEIRIGVHTGSVVAGIVGVKKFAYDIWGDTVNTAARMEQNSQAGKINISETTYRLVREQFTCEYRGEIAAKNKGNLKMYFVG